LAAIKTPEFKIGDKTALPPGTCFAVDGAASKTGVGTVRVGDSVVVKENCYEYLIPYEKGTVIISVAPHFDQFYSSEDIRETFSQVVSGLAVLGLSVFVLFKR
jgi:Xaa-Pro aminopeptidase